MAIPSTCEGGHNIRAWLDEIFESQDVVLDMQCIGGGQLAREARYAPKRKRGKSSYNHQMWTEVHLGQEQWICKAWRVILTRPHTK